MNILIDFTQIPLQKVGVGVYGIELLKNLSHVDKNNNYFVLIQDDEKSLGLENTQNFHPVRVRSKIFRLFFFRCLLEQIYIPYLILKKKIDLVHSLHYSFPLITFNAKKVVTVHDMTFFKFPELHIFLKRYYFRFFIRASSVLADTILTDSQSTLNDFRQEFESLKKPAYVIHIAKSEDLTPNIAQKKIDAVKAKYKIEGDYLLFIGTIEPRKNIKNLIVAYSKLLKSNKRFKLVIAGKKGWYYDEIFTAVDELNLKREIIFTGFIDEEDKHPLIVGAKIFIYPSIYEGFGIPVLEALACGTPTITSNISSMPEIAGDAALLINPSEISEIHSAMKKLLEDNTLYKSLKEKSLLQARKFTWENQALNTLKAYNALF